MPPFCEKCQTHFKCVGPDKGKCNCPPLVSIEKVSRFAFECDSCGHYTELSHQPSHLEGIRCDECGKDFRASYTR